MKRPVLLGDLLLGAVAWAATGPGGRSIDPPTRRIQTATLQRQLDQVLAARNRCIKDWDRYGREILRSIRGRDALAVKRELERRLDLSSSFLGAWGLPRAASPRDLSRDASVWDSPVYVRRAAILCEHRAMAARRDTRRAAAAPPPLGASWTRRWLALRSSVGAFADALEALQRSCARRGMELDEAATQDSAE